MPGIKKSNNYNWGQIYVFCIFVRRLETISYILVQSRRSNSFYIQSYDVLKLDLWSIFCLPQYVVTVGWLRVLKTQNFIHAHCTKCGSLSDDENCELIFIITKLT